MNRAYKHKKFVMGFHSRISKAFIKHLLEAQREYYAELPTKFENIFTGMTNKDIKAKKWIDKFMAKL